MAEDRKYVEVGGKKYPLKTEAERARSSAKSSETATASNGNGRSANISIPSIPQTNDASRQVLLALSVAFLVFLAAGGKVEKVIAKARGLPEPESASFDAKTIFAWGGLFVGLMILADTPAGELAKALAWLILFTVLLEFGPQAIDNVMSLSGAPSASGEPSAKTPPPEFRGGHLER
jgi:hypothetical protein